MSNDSAFKRLLLDTVATVILQPPSTSSLIELLRITTPTLLSSNEEQYKESFAIVHDLAKREKLFRTLQLRIHPDKHSDTRATALFQDVATYYEKCCEEMEREDTRQKSTSQQSSFTNNNNNNNATTNTTTEDPYAQYYNSSTNTYPGMNKSRQYQHPSRFNNPQRPNGSTSANTTNSDYERYTDKQEQPNYDRFPWRRRMKRKKNNNRNNSRQPPSHLCISIVSTILFPPLGVCALMHSLKVNKAYNESRYQDAKKSSDKAYSAACLGILCFIVIFLSLWIREDGKDFDWERIKHVFPWNNGP